jgi:hypothetical protein
MNSANSHPYSKAHTSSDGMWVSRTSGEPQRHVCKTFPYAALAALIR